MYGTLPAVGAGAAQAWFIAGTLPLIVAGGAHALGTLVDTFRLTYFAPVERSVKPAMEGSDVRLRHMVPGGSKARPSMWRAWLGFNLSHGLGACTFGLMCLLVALDDFQLVERIEGLQALTIAVSAAYFATALRFWFYAPVLITGSAFVCFTISAVLSA